MKGGGVAADKSPTAKQQPQFDALDMVGGKIAATERTSNQGDITPLSLQNKKSPRPGGVANN
jgi:hypothetical protein